MHIPHRRQAHRTRVLRRHRRHHRNRRHIRYNRDRCCLRIRQSLRHRRRRLPHPHSPRIPPNRSYRHPLHRERRNQRLRPKARHHSFPDNLPDSRRLRRRNTPVQHYPKFLRKAHRMTVREDPPRRAYTCVSAPTNRDRHPIPRRTHPQARNTHRHPAPRRLYSVRLFRIAVIFCLP